MFSLVIDVMGLDIMGLIRCEIASSLIGVWGVLALRALVLIPKTFCGSFLFFFLSFVFWEW